MKSGNQSGSNRQACDSATVSSWPRNHPWFTNDKADPPGITIFRLRILACAIVSLRAELLTAR